MPRPPHIVSAADACQSPSSLPHLQRVQASKPRPPSPDHGRPSPGLPKWARPALDTLPGSTVTVDPPHPPPRRQCMACITGSHRIRPPHSPRQPHLTWALRLRQPRRAPSVFGPGSGCGSCWCVPVTCSAGGYPDLLLLLLLLLDALLPTTRATPAAVTATAQSQPSRSPAPRAA